MEDGVFVPKKKPQVLASLAAIIGAFGLGTVLGWSSPAFPSLDSTKPFDLTSEEKSWIASLALLGATVASPLAGLSVELLGRKRTIVLVSLPFCVGWLLVALTIDKLLISIGRFVTGFCGGALSLAIPIYISEVSQGDIGAQLASGVQVAITVGILFSYSFGAFIAWSWLSTLCALFPLLLGVLIFCMPETPRFLLSKGRLFDASRKLSWLRGAGLTLNVDHELQETKRRIDEVKQAGGRCKDFCTWSSIKSLLICLVLMILQQFSGVYAILFYAVYIFRDAEGAVEANNAAIALALVLVLATMLSTGALERSGRKRLVIISELVMAMALGTLGAYFYLTPLYPEIKDHVGLIPIISLMAYISAFAIGIGPIPWIIMREMFPLSAIGFASSVASTVSWGLAFLVTFFFYQLKTEVGNAWTYWTFAIICAVGATFILCIVPETKGKTAEQIRQGIGKRGAATSTKMAESLKSNMPGMPTIPAMPTKLAMPKFAKLPQFRKSKKPEGDVKDADDKAVVATDDNKVPDVSKTPDTQSVPETKSAPDTDTKAAVATSVDSKPSTDSPV